MKLLQVIMFTLFTATSTAQNAVPPKPIEAPKVVTASREASLAFRNTLLEIQVFTSQAEAATAQANLRRATLGEQIAVIMKEGKIDADKYTVLRSSSGAYILDDNGLLQFQLKEAK